MKKSLLIFSLLLLVIINKFYAGASDEFRIKVNITSTGEYTFYAESLDLNIYYEEVGYEGINYGYIPLGASSPISIIRTINLPSEGIYRLKIDAAEDPTFTYFRDNSGQLLEIEQWGTAQWTSLYKSFSFNHELQITATDVPNLTNCMDMTETFYACNNFIGHYSMNNWDVSNITTLNATFANCLSFNQSLNNWNVYNVNNMYQLFAGCHSFNQSLDNWDVTNVTDMTEMFRECPNFNQPLNDWNVENVYNFTSMFHNSVNFNQPLDNWVLWSAIDLTDMFLNSGIDCDNLSHTLRGWSENPLTGTSLSTNISSSIYNEIGLEAINTLTTDYGWSFIDGTYDPGCTGPLSSQIITLYASIEDNMIRLDWTSTLDTSFINNFELEKSSDMKNFEKVNNISSSSSTLILPQDAQYLIYRLSANTKYGHKVFSNPVKINNVQSSRINIYPNPVTKGESISIKVEQDTHARIYNIIGQEIMTVKLSKGLNNITTNRLLVGSYILHVGNNKYTLVIK